MTDTLPWKATKLREYRANHMMTLDTTAKAVLLDLLALTDDDGRLADARGKPLPRGRMAQLCRKDRRVFDRAWAELEASAALIPGPDGVWTVALVQVLRGKSTGKNTGKSPDLFDGKSTTYGQVEIEIPREDNTTKVVSTPRAPARGRKAGAKSATPNPEPAKPAAKRE